MTEYVRRGGRLRVWLYFVDRSVGLEGVEATEPIDLLAVSDLTLTITRPDGTTLEDEDPVVTEPTAGVARWDADEGVLNQVGEWRAEAWADGYPCEPVEWFVRP